MQLTPEDRVMVLAPIVRGRKGEFKDLLDELDQQGFRELQKVDYGLTADRIRRSQDIGRPEDKPCAGLPCL